MSRPVWFGLALCVAAAAVSLQMAGYRLAGSDAGAMATAASKILDGGVFYRDIDSYPFPGAAYLLAGAMQVFGESLSVARALASLLFVVSVLSLYLVALRLLGPARAGVFGASLLAFKFLAWPSFTAYTYWDVAFALGCGASALLVRHERGHVTGGLLAAGLLCGLAVTAKQSLGLPLGFAGVAVLLSKHERARTRWAEAAAFAAASSAPLLLMLSAFASAGLAGPMLSSGMLHPFSDYLPTSSTSFFEPLSWWRFGELRELPGLAYSNEPLWGMLTRGQLPESLWVVSELLSRGIYTSVPIVFAVAAWRFVRSRNQPSEEAFGVFAPLAAAIFVSAFPRADFAHVISVYPVVLLLLFALLPKREETSRLEVGAVTVVLSACLALTWLQRSELTHELRLPRAELRIHPDKVWIEAAARIVAEEVPPGEPFFVYGHEAHYYFLADRYSPWRFSQLYPGQGGGDGGEAIITALAARPPRVIIRGATRFPRVTPIPDYLPKLHAWIRANYVIEPNPFEHHQLDGRAPRPRQFQLLRLRR